MFGQMQIDAEAHQQTRCNKADGEWVAQWRCRKVCTGSGGSNLTDAAVEDCGEAAWATTSNGQSETPRTIGPLLPGPDAQTSVLHVCQADRVVQGRCKLGCRANTPEVHEIERRLFAEHMSVQRSHLNPAGAQCPHDRIHLAG